MDNYLKITLFFLILILLPASAVYSANSQETKKLTCAVIEFNNTSEEKTYDYLKLSFQNSIIESLNSFPELELIDSSTANEVAKEKGLTLDTYNDLRTVLTFAAKTKANIIILGNYKVENEDIEVEVLIYSIAQLKIIKEFSLKGKVEENYTLLDNIASKSSEEFKKKLEELQVSIDQILKQVQPPKYDKEPYISSISPEGLKIEWATNKKTISTLYIGLEKNFGISSALMTLPDESQDVTNHYVTLDIDDLDIGKNYFYFSEEVDFVSNISYSEIKQIKKSEINDVLEQQFTLKEEKLITQIQKGINNNDMMKCLYNTIDWKKLYDRYSKTISLSNEKSKTIEKVQSIVNLILKGDELSGNKKYIDAENTYNEAKEMVSKDVNEIIPIKIINNRIEGIKIAVEVENKLLEGDSKLRNGNNKLAREIYRDALKTVIEKEIEHLISKESIKQKMNEIPKKLYYMYVDLGLGSVINLVSHNDLGNPVNLSWSFNFNGRINRLFTFGTGLNLFFWEVFAKISPINTNGLYHITHEMFIKVSILFDFKIIQLFIGNDAETGIGTEISIGYLWSKDNLGFSAEVRLWTVYHEGRIREQMPVNLALTVGFVYNFLYLGSKG